MKRDIEQLIFNLRTGDPDTYFMCLIVLLCGFAALGMANGWF